MLRFDRILPLETRAQAPLKEILTALADGAPSRLFPRSEAEWAYTTDGVTALTARRHEVAAQPFVRAT